MERYEEKYNEWIKDQSIDEESKKELEQIKDNKEEMEDRFYKDLEFGTAGLRGIIGVGSNRMNKYTVTKATQGLANYIKKQGGENRGVAIAYDCRIMSEEFSEESALCLNANGIKTYKFDSVRPTPELSFAVRELGCIAGIVITASHNPPEYNGYKVYWEDGAQIVSPIDKGIIDEVNKITDFSTIKTMSKEEAIKQGLYNIIGKDIDDRYIEELKKLIVNKEAIKEMQKDIRIVYTPLHGTGGMLAKRIFDAKRRLLILQLPETDLRVYDCLLLLAELQNIPRDHYYDPQELNATIADIANWCGINVNDVQKVLNNLIKSGKIDVHTNTIKVRNLKEIQRQIDLKRKK